jgi:predicted rRNA methylase YqxC with S4 and FtsJ domains
VGRCYNIFIQDRIALEFPCQSSCAFMGISFDSIWPILPSRRTFTLLKMEIKPSFRLKPVKIARPGVVRPTNLNEIERIIEDNLEFLLKAWEEEKSRHVNG